MPNECVWERAKEMFQACLILQIWEWWPEEVQTLKNNVVHYSPPSGVRLAAVILPAL